MNHYIPSKSQELVRVLESAGYLHVSRRGSHIKLRKGNKTIIVPDGRGKDINRMLSRRLMKEAGL